MMQYTVPTKNGNRVRVIWINDYFLIYIIGSKHSSEIGFTLDYVIHRFEALIAENGGAVDFCQRCAGSGYINIVNGDDDVECPECSFRADMSQVPF